MKINDWVIWNKEAKSIVAIGNENDMRDRARTLNEVHQTDANVVQHYVSRED